jgi:hypothetical protein
MKQPPQPPVGIPDPGTIIKQPVPARREAPPPPVKQ